MQSARSLTPEQETTITRLFENDHTLLVAGTGAGKTIIALSAMMELIEEGVIQKFIVAAPARVVSNLVWPNEAAKWPHLRKLRITQLEGDATERTRRMFNTMGETDILVVSLNNLEWLLHQDHECHGIVIDELSKAAGKQSNGLKSKKWSGSLVWRCGMTATPVSNNFEKLWAQARILDGGAALGRNKNNFMTEYFTPDYNGYNWELKGFADAQIMDKVSGLIHLIEDKKEETLPPLYEHLLRFDMPGPTRVIYNDMKKHMVTDNREAANQAVKSSCLRQLASGFLYPDRGDYNILFHKHDAARELMMQAWCQALGDRKGVIFYEYKAQREDILQLHEMTEDVDEFINGTGRILVAQINALSHGIDGLQNVCCDVLKYHPFWSADATTQGPIGRVWRQGQQHAVNVTTLVCNDTLDDLVVDRVDDRGQWMEKFQAHLKGEYYDGR